MFKKAVKVKIIKQIEGLKIKSGAECLAAETTDGFMIFNKGWTFVPQSYCELVSDAFKSF